MIAQSNDIAYAADRASKERSTLFLIKYVAYLRLLLVHNKH